VAFLVLGVTAALTAAAIEFLPRTLYFPNVEFSTPEGYKIVFLRRAAADQRSCEQQVGRIASALRPGCVNCTLRERCLRGLDDEQRKALSREPLPLPSARNLAGVTAITFSAPDPKLALMACQMSERQSAAQPADQRLRCFPAGVSR
jgi:hypothetical protein